MALFDVEGRRRTNDWETFDDPPNDRDRPQPPAAAPEPPQSPEPPPQAGNPPPSGNPPLFTGSAQDYINSLPNYGVTGTPTLGARHVTNYQGAFENMTTGAGRPATTQTLEQLAPALTLAGMPVQYNAAGVPGKVQLPDGRFVDVLEAAGIGGRRWQWDTGSGGGRPSGPSGTSVGNTPNVFTDPATSEWERLIREYVDRLNTPRPPGYTASQQELINTQALDPLERQRQQQRRNAIMHYAGLGHGENSGPLQMALADIDRQFDALGAQARAGFALNQIGLEDTRFNQNESRAGQAVDSMFQIPRLADSRFSQAANFVNGNPVNAGTGLAGIQMGGNQFNQIQNQQFWADFIAALASLF